MPASRPKHAGPDTHAVVLNTNHTVRVGVLKTTGSNGQKRSWLALMSQGQGEHKKLGHEQAKTVGKVLGRGGGCNCTHTKSLRGRSKAKKLCTPRALGKNYGYTKLMRWSTQRQMVIMLTYVGKDTNC